MGLLGDRIKGFERWYRSKSQDRVRRDAYREPEFSVPLEAIHESDSALGGTTLTLFTVPSGKILFITSAYLHLAHTDTIASLVGILRFTITSGTKNIIRIQIPPAGVEPSNAVATMAFEPFKVSAGESVTVGGSSATGAIINGGFSGFLEDVAKGD